MAEENKSEKNENRESSTTTFWEWIVAAAGLLLVVSAVGTTFYNALTEEKTPPRLEVTIDSITPNANNFLVKFVVKNTGGQTAAAVTVEGELKNGAETPETASATLTYAPAHSERRGGLYFTKNPQQGDLQIRVTGYEEP